MQISYLTCWRNLLFLTYIYTGITIWIVISFRWSEIWAFSSVVMLDPFSKLLIIINLLFIMMNSIMITAIKFPKMLQIWVFQRWLLTHVACVLADAAVWSSSIRLTGINFAKGIWWSLLFSLNLFIKMALWQVTQMMTKII